MSQLPRKARMRAAQSEVPATRADHFSAGSGQLPRRADHVASTDLQPGDHVRLAIGKEGETVMDRLMQGRGQAGVVTGHVVRNDRAGVHLGGDTMTWNGTPLKSSDPVRWQHDDISQVRKL